MIGALAVTIDATMILRQSSRNVFVNRTIASTVSFFSFLDDVFELARVTNAGRSSVYGRKLVMQEGSFIKHRVDSTAIK